MSVSNRFPTSGQTVQFYGEILEFTPEIRHLMIDHAATVAFGQFPESRDRLGGRPDKRSDLDREIDTVLDTLAGAGTPDEIYAYMVRPNPELDDASPVGLIAMGGLGRVIEQISRDFPPN